MIEYIVASGAVAFFMALESIFGLMVASMRANSSKIRSTVTEYILQSMGEYTRDFGRTAFSMV